MTKKKTHGIDKSGSGHQTGSVSVGGSGLPTPEPEPRPLENQATIDTSPQQRSRAKGKVVEKAPLVSKPTAEMSQTATTVNAMAMNVDLLAKMVETIGSQASLLTTYHVSTKIREDIKALQKAIDEQREKEKKEAEEWYDKLKELTKASPIESLRERWDAQIRRVIQDEVSSRVDIELDKHIPALKDQVYQRLVRMGKIDNDLYNAEQRRRNAHLKEKELLHRLRIPTMSRSSSGSTATPSLLTPQNNLLLSTDVSVDVEECVSPVFPKDIETLYQYRKTDREKLKQFLQFYEQDTPDESAYQFNKVLHFVGAGSRFYTFDPPPAPQNPQVGRLQPAAQDPNVMLSPLIMVGSL